MRTSTAVMSENAVASILAQQTRLARTQSEVATGKRVQTPADDPAAATHILTLRRSLLEDQQFAGNASAATNRLSFEEQALADAGNALQRLQELAVQANGGTLDQSTRAMLAREMRARAGELLDIANRQDANGEFVFAGLRSQSQPFARGATDVQYFGDGGTRAVQVSTTQRVTDGHSGYEAFMDLRGGNGTFVTTAAAANTGAAWVDTGTVVDRTAWVPDSYTVQFTGPASYEVRDGANALVSSGAYVSGSAIEFRGIRVSVSGNAAAGDSFAVGSAPRQDVFETLDRLIATVESGSQTPAERAQFVTAMGRSINDLARANDPLLGIRAEVGARLSTLDNAESSRADAKLELEKTLSELQDVDYAEAVSRMNLQLAGLQAAQQSYARIAQLSLFDYL